jgi:hypothetical protein
VLLGGRSLRCRLLLLLAHRLRRRLGGAERLLQGGCGGRGGAAAGPAGIAAASGRQ